MENPYHAGETAVQELFGEKLLAERNGRVISNKIVPGAIKFIENQYFFLATSRNLKGEMWISALAGAQGFIRVIGECTISINTRLLYSNPSDVFWQNIIEIQKIGLLFIELSSRRRFRVNGSLNMKDSELVITVSQSYPNCPKYIQQRHVHPTEKPHYKEPITSGQKLTEPLADLIGRADTFFVGSCSADGDMDASHRGGVPGFVTIENESTLIIPDYPGNSMFNTLGNFRVNPAAAMTFIDFQNHTNLQLSGTAEVLLSNDDPPPGHTNRFWVFTIRHWAFAENLRGFASTFVGYSPFNPALYSGPRFNP